MGFPRQEYWSGLPFAPPGNLPDPGSKLESAASVSCIVVGGRGGVIYHYCHVGCPLWRILTSNYMFKMYYISIDLFMIFSFSKMTIYLF